jgi:Fe-S cluster biosynthesis and repair protein YggX
MCVKLGREADGLDRVPFRNELGQRLYENVSKDAWRAWLEHSKMLINEYRIDLISKEGSAFLLKECEKYFFGEGSSVPKEFKSEGEGASSTDQKGGAEHKHGPDCDHDHGHKH